MGKFHTGIDFDFEAAHILQVDGSSGRIHGHAYKGRIYVTTDGSLDSSGMVVDFRDMKRNMRELIEQEWDHRFLISLHHDLHQWAEETEETYPGVILMDVEPTTENIAEKIKQEYELATGYSISRIELSEGPRNHVAIDY